MNSMLFDPMVILGCSKDPEMRAWAVHELTANGFTDAAAIERDLRVVAGVR
ncbi:MAG: hypothetical protein ACXVXP_00330 [Mycobacteriaceae bacterium]